MSFCLSLITSHLMYNFHNISFVFFLLCVSCLQVWLYEECMPLFNLHRNVTFPFVFAIKGVIIVVSV